MKILLLGSGGREHALAWKMAQSNKCKALYIAPGNGGTRNAGTNVNLDTTDFNAIKAFVLDKDINLVVVGPEGPLVAGIANFFSVDKELKHITVIGPVKEGAELEGSKSFAKAFMVRYGIPTAAYLEVNETSLEQGKAFIDEQKLPIVLKADGLAAGKGVLIINDKEEAKKSLAEMLEGMFGEASKKVVIEQFLQGIEFSVFVLTDGKSYQLLPVAKDYKRIGEGDTGLNTGGMGAVSPLPFVSKDLMKKVKKEIIAPTLEGLQKEGIDYKGFIYFGLMKVGDEPFVIEYNCRMGDPETQAVIPRIKSDLVELFKAVGKGELDKAELKIKKKACAAVVLASGGYPGEYEKGLLIQGADDIDGSLVFHSGTHIKHGELYTAGGRVITVSTLGENLQDAIKNSLETASRIDFEGKYFRKDIGQDVSTKKTLKHLQDKESVKVD
ncbi:MAG: phosphoribosylamine--glycine ligase [Chitinophagales bacterium]|nr:phosphoribosylamine--glycine ligase [Chitinophagales bacterium]